MLRSFVPPLRGLEQAIRLLFEITNEELVGARADGLRSDANDRSRDALYLVSTSSSASECLSSGSSSPHQQSVAGALKTATSRPIHRPKIVSRW
jgi:hypothetical protein